MDTNLPFILIRIPSTSTIDVNRTFQFTSTMPNSRHLINGAHVIVDSRVGSQIDIRGYGRLGSAEQVGLFRTATRVAKKYESVFVEWKTAKQPLRVNSSIYNKILLQHEVKDTIHAIRPLAKQSYEALTNYIKEPQLLDTAVKQVGERGMFDDRARLSLHRDQKEIANAEFGHAIYKEEEESILVPIYYGTDRTFGTKESFSEIFTGERAAEITYGIAEVSIPKIHKTGKLESPAFWKIWKRRDTSKYVVLTGVRWFDEILFTSEVATRVKASDSKDAFVFIHGFNVSFEDAARRTAQLAFDLNFLGAPILYSWPSRGGVLDYFADEATIDWTVKHLTHFLETIVRKTGADVVHVIGHSMGNRALVHAMKNLYAQPLPIKPIFHQVLLTAPDIDTGVFENLAKEIASTTRRLTLYASSNDRALKISQDIHSYPRIGQTIPKVTIVPGVDTIDASTVDTSLFGIGHSYASGSRSVLSDIYDLLHKGDPPDNRFNLAKQSLDGNVYWAFKP